MRKLLTLLTVLILGIFAANAQSRTVTGKVVDSTGNAVPGATIQIQGTSKGTLSGTDGGFSITAKNGDVLVISAVNFTTQEVKVGENSNYTINMSGSSSTLGEVVVTAMGIKRSTRSTGYSVTSIPTSSITQARATNLANGLSGKVAGLAVFTVNNGVNPQTRIVLRGERSILGNNQAAIVLDNIPITSDYITSINPDDIVSTTILKGANAAALYGS